MPKRGSDVQITKDSPDGSVRFGGIDDDTDPVALVYWQLKDRPRSEQLKGFEDWVKKEYKGAEEQRLRERFQRLQREGDEKSNMSKRATDAQMARRRLKALKVNSSSTNSTSTSRPRQFDKDPRPTMTRTRAQEKRMAASPFNIATPKGRPGAVKSVNVPLPSFNPGASALQQQLPLPSFGGFGQDPSRNGGFNFQFGGSQPAPSFGATPAPPVSSAPLQNGGFNYNFGGFGQGQQQPSTDAQSQKQQQAQPNGMFQGAFGAAAQPQVSTPFGSGSASFTFGQAPSSQPTQRQANPFATTSQSFNGQPSTTAGLFAGGFDTASASEQATSQPLGPIGGAFNTSVEQKSVSEAPQSNPLTLFSGFGQSTIAGTPALTSGEVSAPTTAGISSTSQPSIAFGGVSTSTIQPGNPTATANMSIPPLFSNFAQSALSAPQEQQQPLMTTSLPPSTMPSDAQIYAMSSTPSLEARREWCDAFDAKLNTRRYDDPLAPQPEVLAAFSHLWKVEKPVDQPAQQLSATAPVTIADTSPQSPSRSQPSPPRKYTLPSALSKYERPYEQLTLDDWNSLTRDEKLATLQGAYRNKLASCEPGQQMLELTESFINSWSQLWNGDDSLVKDMINERDMINEIHQQPGTTTFTQSTAAQQPPTPAPSKPAGSMFAAGGFGGFSTPQPNTKRSIAPEAPKTVAAPIGSHPSDKFFSPTPGNKRKASDDDVQAGTSKRSRDENAFINSNKDASSTPNPSAGLTQTAGFTFMGAAKSTPAADSPTKSSVGAAADTTVASPTPASTTANTFQNILDQTPPSPTKESAPSISARPKSPLKTSASLSARPLSPTKASNPFADIPTSPDKTSFPDPFAALSSNSTNSTTPAEPGTTTPAGSPSKAPQATSSEALENPVKTPFNSAKTPFFPALPTDAASHGDVAKPAASTASVSSPTKETAAAGQTAGATPSADKAPLSGGLFGFGNVAPPAAHSTPTTGGLLNFSKQAATNGLGSAPPKFFTLGNKAVENGGVVTPGPNPLATLQDPKTAPAKKSTFTASDDNSGSVFNSPNLKPVANASNLFGHLSDAERSGSAVEMSDSDDEGPNAISAVSSNTIPRAQLHRGTKYDKKRSSGHFESDSEDEEEPDHPPRRKRKASPMEMAPTASTPVTGRGGLFDRISYDKDGKPERELTPPIQEGIDYTVYGFRATTSQQINSTLAVHFGKLSPGGDHTWKPESPIKFSNSTNAGNASVSRPLINFQPASPSHTSAENKENATTTDEASGTKPFSTLFGKSPTPSGTATPLQSAMNTAPTATGFNFGLAPSAPSGSTSLFTTSGFTSRATTPGASSAMATDAEGEDDDMADEQGDLMGLDAMREANDIEFECHKVAAYKLVNGGWSKMGVGPLYVLQDKREGTRSIRMLADGVGRVLVSSRITKESNFSVKREKQITFVVPDMGPISMRFSIGAEAQHLVAVCNRGL